MSPLGIGMFAASGAAAAKAPPTAVFQQFGSLIGNTSGVTQTINIGAAAPDRIVFLLTQQYLDDGYTVSRTINGTTPLKLFEANAYSVQWLRVLAIAIPTGTTASLYMKNTGSPITLSYFVYSVYGLSSLALFQSKNTGSSNTTTTTINVPANGMALGWRLTGGGVNSPTGTNWTGMTRDTTQIGGGSNVADPSSAQFTTATAVTGRTISATTSTGYAGAMGVISFGNGA